MSDWHQCKTRKCDFVETFINRIHQLQGVTTVPFDRKAIARLGFVHPDAMMPQDG